MRGDPANVTAYSGTDDIDAAVLWLEPANAIVTGRLAVSGLSEGVLTRIEEHLAAHFIEIGGGREKTSERLPDWAVTYAASAKNLADLRRTRNGQIAIMLDTSGALGEAAKPLPSFAVLGPG